MKSALPPSNEAERLASLRALKILDSLPEQEYDDIVKLASAICGAPIALVSLIDQDRQWFKARLGLDASETPRNVAFCAHAILDSGTTFMVPDATDDERFRDNPLVTSDPNIRFYAGAPLVSPEGFAVGTLCVIDRTPRQLDTEQKAALELLARQVDRLLALRSKTAQLEEANARFRAAFDQNAVGITLVAPDGRLLEVNRAFANMLGYAEPDLVGTNVRSITHPDDLGATEARLQSDEEVPLHVAKRYLTKDGKIVWTESVGRRVRDERGRPLYWVTQVQNVTARAESEERLRLQYAMTRILAEALVLEDALPKMLDTLGATGGWDVAAIWEVDETAGRMSCLATRGISGEETDLCDVIRRTHFGPGEGVVGRAWSAGQPSWTEDLHAHSDPVVVARSQALNIRSMFAIPVRAAGAILGLVHFVSHRHRPFEPQILSLTEALCAQVGVFLLRKKAQEMQQRMVAVLETTSDFVAMVSGNGRTLYLNGAARALLEIADGEPSPDSMADFTPVAAREALSAELRALVVRGGDRFAGEFVYRSRSGREIPVSQVVVVRTTPEREVLFYAAVARDITEAKRVERMKNEFVSTVSHELRTPLTSIRGALGLLEGGVVGSLDEAAREIVQIARTNSDRLIRLINDMLDLDKIEAGKLEMAMTEATAASLAASAIGSVKGMASDAAVSLRSEVEPTLRVRADIDRVVQVITNLLSNAVKFTPKGGTVTLRARALSGRRARFEVQDTGPGIAPELRARLFQKFEQLDASDTRAKGGTGLGLAISKAIVEQLGGTIGVDSTPGAGSTFWFELARVSVTVTVPPPAPAPRPRGKATVLLVEDDASTRSLLGTMIERTLGLRVLQAPDGAVAVHLARSEAPDVVVLDLGVPRPNGFEVVSILRDDGEKTPLVVYSGRDLSNDERERLTLGHTRFLTKGRGSEQVLVETVRELVAELEEAS